MKFMCALKKVKEGKVVKFNRGWFEPYDDYFFIKAVINYKGIIVRSFERYSFYSEHGFKEAKRISSGFVWSLEDLG